MRVSLIMILTLRFLSRLPQVKPASLQAKRSRYMKVGQQIKLSDYLEYKDEKKKKLPNYRSCGVTVDFEGNDRNGRSQRL